MLARKYFQTVLFLQSIVNKSVKVYLSYRACPKLMRLLGSQMILHPGRRNFRFFCHHSVGLRLRLGRTGFLIFPFRWLNWEHFPSEVEGDAFLYNRVLRNPLVDNCFEEASSIESRPFRL